ncbi:hypothetical protein PTTG_02218 [Puccinia triticina 1-1 BBBD Race 1]|uniref:ISWI chromatin-remodeling complex ATPase ISW2 n=1 Tax=Puccinia triticina (isolate 1-1 / race 1 (BBBD)) TaxID=630390 RepID=A0A180GIX0_PUCT1|nr:hypothetical protein PTTG_02218 [Puccinia triticina 1-1 BBBD Race 1]
MSSKRPFEDLSDSDTSNTGRVDDESANGPVAKRLRSRNKPVVAQKPKSTARPKPRKTRKPAHNPEWQAQQDAFQSSYQASIVSFRARQRRYLSTHRDLFISLLPPERRKHFEKHIEDRPTNGVTLADREPIPNEVSPWKRVPQPESIKGELKSYQITGLSFLVYLHSNGMNGILGDEMGLGKTLQTLALLAHLKEGSAESSQFPHLIICPLSVLSSWGNEIKRWTNLSFINFHGTHARRKTLKASLIGLGVQTPGEGSPELVVASYESYQAEESWFKHRSWGYVILDEGHRIKNHETLMSQSLQTIRSTHRLILTGTPVQNNLIELWCLFHWLLPEVFPEHTRARFKTAFDLTAGSYDSQMLKSSHALLKLLMLRRTKDSVKGELSVPAREEIDLYIPMSSCQRFWTKRLIMRCDTSALKDIFNGPSIKTENNENLADRTDAALKTEGILPPGTTLSTFQPAAKLSQQIQYALESEEGSTNSQSYRKLMNLLMQLRKVCNHPYLMPNSEPEPFQIAEHVVNASSKLVMLDKMLKSELPKGKRFLIFSGFTSMLDILEDFMNLRSINYLRLDGSTPVARRNLAIRIFQQSKTTDTVRSHGSSSPRVVPMFLISTKAGGLGINLTAADTVVLYDSSWNPQVDIQAIARAHRIGQTEKVTVYRLICAESVEQQMIGRLRKKLYLSLKILDSKGTNSDNTLGTSDETIDEETTMKTSMSTSELCAILRGGASSLHKHWGQASDSDETLKVDDDERTGYTEFLNASFDEILNKAKEFAKIEQTKLQIEVGGCEPSHSDEEIVKKIEEEELGLLRGAEVVRCRLFEGKKYTASNKDILHEWDNLQSKRASKATITIIDGHAVQAESVNNARWQAVKTLTSDPVILAKLQDQKGKKKVFEHEETCMCCHDPGNLYLCAQCPRVAHSKCMGYTPPANLNFICSQHKCVGCQRGAAEAGGMLYRCQTCPDAYCEDCLALDNFYSMGDTLPEFMMLGYGPVSQAHYIRCIECLNHFEANPETKAIWEAEEERLKEQLALKNDLPSISVINEF